MRWVKCGKISPCGRCHCVSMNLHLQLTLVFTELYIDLQLWSHPNFKDLIVNCCQLYLVSREARGVQLQKNTYSWFCFNSQWEIKYVCFSICEWLILVMKLMLMLMLMLPSILQTLCLNLVSTIKKIILASFKILGINDFVTFITPAVTTWPD